MLYIFFGVIVINIFRCKAVAASLHILRFIDGVDILIRHQIRVRTVFLRRNCTIPLSPAGISSLLDAPSFPSVGGATCSRMHPAAATRRPCCFVFWSPERVAESIPSSNKEEKPSFKPPTLGIAST